MKRASLARVCAFSAIVCAAWAIFAGKDVNWDLLNYHYYLPYEWLHGRLDQDYFAASGQSYLNPAGYLLFYGLVASGWHAVLATIVLASVHGLSLSLLFAIAWRIFAHRPFPQRVSLALLAAALGAATAIFWALVGSSFLEPLLAVPMLAGLLLLLTERPAGAMLRALGAGLLFGAAAALKYYNAIFAVAALPLVLLLPRARWPERVRAGLAYALGGAVALAVLAGPWMALMWRKFGNPVFPLLNGWFRAPEAPAVNMFAGRFALHGLADALAFPFRLIAPDRMLYAEITAPDMRFAALVLCALALPLLALRGTRAGEARALRRLDLQLLGFFGVALVLWLATSVNARYGLPVLLLAGLCLARLVERLLPFAAARVALGVLIVVQVVACAMVSAPRWFIADRWSASWLPFSVAEPLRREPALYLTVETLPMAAVAPFVHAGSAFVNVRGQYSIPPGTPALDALLSRHAGHVRVLGRFLQLRQDGRPRDEVVEAYDFTLIRYGLRIDPASCSAIAWAPDEADWLSRLANRLAGEPESHEKALSLGACDLRPARRDPRDLERERLVSFAFDRIEASCAGLLGGQRALTESLGADWMRNYPAIDARLETHGDRVILARYLALSYVDLGSLKAWQRDDLPVPSACGPLAELAKH